MSDGQADTSNPARRNRSFLSIRARLIVLALLAIAPLLLARLHEVENARVARLHAVNTEVIDLARRGVESQREIIYSVRALLQIISRVYARMPLDMSGCNQYIADLTPNIPWIRDLSVASTDGRIQCSTEPLAIGLDVSDRPHFRNALTSREFGLSDYLINRLNHAPSLIATFPIVKDDGAPKGVVLAVINLQWIGDLAATAAALGRVGPIARQPRYGDSRLSRSAELRWKAICRRSLDEADVGCRRRNGVDRWI
jgi:hypothetical protein